MVILLDPSTKQLLPNAIHVDRLKVACIRVPTPDNFFTVTNKLSPVICTDKAVQTVAPTEVDGLVPSAKYVQSRPVIEPSSRQKRTIKKPARYKDLVDPDELYQDSVSSDSGFHKIKRVLAQRQTNNGAEYLVQVVGEPAQNAFWVSSSNLNAKALRGIQQRPPPLV